MFSACTASARTAVSALSAASRAQPVRTAVNLSALKIRIRATKNVAKITNVMKMVSSAKLRGIEDALFRGRTFGESMLNAVANDQLVDNKKGKDEEGILGLFSDASKRHLCVLMTTDRGLCGAVNSSLARSLRRELNAAAKAKVNVKLMTLGDKGRAQIARDYAPIVTSAIDNLFDKDPIFPLAAAIATKVVAQPYDLLTLYYNHYENQAKYHNTYKQIPQMAREEDLTKLKGYEIEPQDNSEACLNLQEYAIASALFYAMLETAACEVSQRVMAMDNATTNAKDMVHDLSLIYNRARQAKITTELSEIIGGATAAESVAVAE